MNKLRIHYLQHVPYEGLGTIKKWAEENGHGLSSTRFYLNEMLPQAADLDWLVVMGGPMSIHDEVQFPWLKAEKAFIRDVLNAGKTMIGICLGAQLLAEALGAKVFKNKHKEIGWMPVRLTEVGIGQAALNGFESEFQTFHWHGDTFETPAGAQRLAYTKACENQAFLFEGRALALQFHMEVDEAAVREMTENNRHELVNGPYIQQEHEIVGQKAYFHDNFRRMKMILDRLAKR